MVVRRMKEVYRIKRYCRKKVRQDSEESVTSLYTKM